jgi:hypothetical protein
MRRRFESSDADSYSAKYIEGLENRLGRMEALLRMSGLLSEDDSGATDLHTLEKRLSEKNRHSDKDKDNTRENDDSTPRNSTPGDSRESNTPATEVPNSTEKEKRRSQISPSDSAKDKDEEEVEAIADAMCSLITSDSGETRYIGISYSLYHRVIY